MKERHNARAAHVEDTIREVRTLLDRKTELYRAKWAEPALVELPEPVRAGWQRYFFIRPDLERSPEAPLLRRLLPVVQNDQWANRHDFAQRDWQRGGRLRPTAHDLRVLDSERELHALDDPLQRCFVMERWRDSYGHWRRRWVVAHPWKFVSRVRPYYYTHRVVPNSEAESEQERINQRLYCGKGWPMRHYIRQRGESNLDRDWRSAVPARDLRQMYVDEEAAPKPRCGHRRAMNGNHIYTEGGQR